jgi:hypothetical protein
MDHSHCEELIAPKNYQETTWMAKISWGNLKREIGRRERQGKIMCSLSLIFYRSKK